MGSASLPTFTADSAGLNTALATAASLGGAAVSATAFTILSPTARLPRKLTTKIQSLEFVEISELLPEAWIPDMDELSTPNRGMPRRAPVSDILVWTECFALMAAVLAEKFPAKSPQLFAYMRRVVHAAKNFRGTAWVAYDRLYRRQAAAQRSLDWATEDAALYNEAFVGQAKVVPRCRHCLSEYHPTEACPDFVQFQWPVHFVQGPITQPYPSTSKPSQEICRKYNDNRCSYPACKYRHACLNCGLPGHPVTSCGSHLNFPRSGPRGRERSPRRTTHPTRPPVQRP